MEAGQENGLVRLRSPYSVDETVRRIEAVLRQRGLTIFCVVDHSGEAERAGLAMRPTRLVIFGSPAAGTPVMVAAPSSAIDLPLKALVSQDAAGDVWVAYNSPDYLRLRHGVPEDLARNISAAGPLLKQAVA